MWRKYRWIKTRRYLCICIPLILFIFYCCLNDDNSNDKIDLKSLSFKLKENYKELLITKKNDKNLLKGILILSDKLRQIKYREFSNALHCYSLIHGYIFNEIDPILYPLCSHIKNFYFQKHCVVLYYLIQTPQIGWLMVLDGDNILVNLTKKIEDYLPSNSNIYLIHNERFYNGEISSGNYLIYNCQWSYLYLFNWINYYSILPKVPYHNNDNGALHLHFALSIGKFSFNCLKLWYKSIDEDIYDRYVGCIKCLLTGQRQFNHIYLLRRGQGFTRDYREPMHHILFNDFLIHGFKNDSSHYYRTKINCKNNLNQWLLPIRQEILITNLTQAQELIRYHDFDAQQTHPHSVGLADIHDCWPYCSLNLTDQKEKDYLNILCQSN